MFIANIRTGYWYCCIKAAKNKKRSVRTPLRRSKYKVINQNEVDATTKCLPDHEM